MDNDIYYNYEYTVKYKNYFDDKDTEECESDCDDIFRHDFLNAFYLKEYDGDKIDKIQMKIYDDLVKNKKMEELMLKLANSRLSSDKDVGFVIMFSYDYFYILHKIIVSYYKYGKIYGLFLDKLEQKITLNDK